MLKCNFFVFITNSYLSSMKNTTYLFCDHSVLAFETDDISYCSKSHIVKPKKESFVTFLT